MSPRLRAMLMTARGPYHDPESTSTKWIFIFVVCSLLTHAILIVAILLITVFMPPPKVPEVKQENTIALTLAPAPVAKPPPPPTPVVMTTKQANVPHTQKPLQSANDTLLTSTAKTATKPDSLLPEINGTKNANDLNNAPNVQTPKVQQPSTTPPTPKDEKPEKPTPPHPNPAQGTQAPSPQPAKPQPQVAPKPKPQTPAVDPDTGLPVLPPLNVPTMAPPNAAAPAATQSNPLIAQSTHGAIGISGANSPAAMATPLGKYQMEFYQIVKSYWDPDVEKSVSLLPVGQVVFRYTVHSDGTITDVTLVQGDNLQLLRTISRHALVAPAPYKPFSDEMKKQVGDSYTDEMSFSIYSN
jgi:outer membrane biosynthesis protein TonB